MTTRIEEAFDAPYQGLVTYQKFQGLLNNARADVSFWGWRYITVQGHSGRYGIASQLFFRIEQLVKENFDFSEEERVIGKELIGRIKHLDSQATEAVARKCFLTRWFTSFLCTARDEFGIILYCPRFFWRDTIEDASDGYFAYYTEVQWKRCYGDKPLPGAGPSMETGWPDRWSFD